MNPEKWSPTARRAVAIYCFVSGLYLAVLIFVGGVTDFMAWVWMMGSLFLAWSYYPWPRKPPPESGKNSV